MNNPLENYWNKFLDEFKKALNQFNSGDLLYAWNSQPDRTNFYKNKLLPIMASSMKYDIKNELFKVDVAMCLKTDNNHYVPLIFIESENKAHDATHEIWKLCCLAAPLKVLITCVEWSDVPGMWVRGGAKNKLLNSWKEIIKDHNYVWPHPCVYGIIVGECDKNNILRFYSNCLSGSGQEIQKEDTICSVQL